MNNQTKQELELIKVTKERDEAIELLIYNHHEEHESLELDKKLYNFLLKVGHKNAEQIKYWED